MQKMRMSLAAIAVFLSVMIMGTNGQGKPFECCLTVSTKEITEPIIGFKFVKSDTPPCLNAVIFFTNDGQTKCSYWRAAWIKEKIQELKKIQLQEWNVKMNSTSTASTPLSSTSV